MTCSGRRSTGYRSYGPRPLVGTLSETNVPYNVLSANPVARRPGASCPRRPSLRTEPVRYHCDADVMATKTEDLTAKPPQLNRPYSTICVADYARPIRVTLPRARAGSVVPTPTTWPSWLPTGPIRTTGAPTRSAFGHCRGRLWTSPGPITGSCTRSRQMKPRPSCSCTAGRTRSSAMSGYCPVSRSQRRRAGPTRFSLRSAVD